MCVNTLNRNNKCYNGQMLKIERKIKRMFGSDEKCRRNIRKRKKLQQSVSKYKYLKNRLISLLSNMSDRDKTH